MIETPCNREPKNQLLAALPGQDYQHLAPYLESVWLPLHQVLYRPGEAIEYVYFPNQAMISLVAMMTEGETVEIGLIGFEGMVGIPVLLGGGSTISQAVVQIAGTAMRLQAQRLKAEFDKGGSLQSLLLRYIQARLTQVSQLAVCNRLHCVEKRLARWLLLVHDSLRKDEFPMTHEYIAQMLGSRRSGVTVAAGILQRAGIIRYRRGVITILSRENLEAVSCECYGIIKVEFARLLGSKNK